MESLEKFKSENMFAARESIQGKLISRYISGIKPWLTEETSQNRAEFNELAAKWVTEHAEDFKKAFDAYLEEHPKLLEELKRDEGAVITAIEESVLHPIQKNGEF